MTIPAHGRDKVTFIGEMTASLSHELQNVFAIIKERAGLLEDMLLLGSTPSEADVVNCLSAIDRHVNRGSALVSSLNRFAHGTDKPVQTIGVQASLAAFIAVSGRIFRGRGGTVEIADGDADACVTLDPVRFQMLIFDCLDLLFRVLPLPAVVSVQVDSHADGVRVQCLQSVAEPRPSGPDEAEMKLDETWLTLEAQAAELGGVLRRCQVPAGIELTFQQ
ncbi:MAG: hypothetical protein CSA22_10425 [Deltaproteobacteria bacterium]|nr:MAG: hypothetical protein CSA22_10425 [Deltaproteobacteria bacterium]